MLMLKKLHIKYDLSEKDVLVSFDTDVKVYDLIKFQKTNQGSSVNLRPIVKKGIKLRRDKFWLKVMELKMVS